MDRGKDANHDEPLTDAVPQSDGDSRPIRDDREPAPSSEGELSDETLEGVSGGRTTAGTGFGATTREGIIKTRSD